jgi:putative addiction module killer protein
MKQYKLEQTEEYEEWFNKQSLKTQAIISKRVKNIRDSGYFGDFKNVSEYDRGITKNCVFELRWDDGKRVYYGKLGSIYLLLLYGGNKNGQDKDIKEAKNLFNKYVEKGE